MTRELSMPPSSVHKALQLRPAHARGRMCGRPQMPRDDPRVRTAKKMHADKTMPLADTCKM